MIEDHAIAILVKIMNDFHPSNVKITVEDSHPISFDEDLRSCC